MDFKEYKLNEIIYNFKYGTMPKKENIKIYEEGKFPIYTGYLFSGYYNECNIEKDTLIVVARGVGGTGDVKIAPEKCYLTNLSIAMFNNENIASNKYLYYYFKIHNLRYLDSGSAQSQITINDLKNVKVPVPQKDTQRKIVNILERLDKKIELNNQINDNLLELIKINYKKYLDVCNNECEEYNATDLLNFIPGVEPGSANYKSKCIDGDVKFYRVGDMNNKCKTYINEKLAKGKIINKDDVLVSFDATVGRVAYGIEGAYSTGMKKIRAKEDAKIKLSSAFIFAYFNNEETLRIINENAKGTIILHASSAIKHLKIKINHKYIKKYMKLFNILFEKMKANKRENDVLEQLRDTLLPKLMNGEINLDKIEI